MIKDLEIKKEFKTSKEVIDLLGEETFLKFDFFTENTIYFKNLQPCFVDGMICNFEISFYLKDDTFYKYQKLGDLLYKNTICDLNLVNEETHERTELFFQRYDENK